MGQNKRFFRIAIPELEAIYIENWDDTNIVFFKNPEKIKPFFALGKQCHLYQLSCE